MHGDARYYRKKNNWEKAVVTTARSKVSLAIGMRH
jgi:hypothetical protein